MFQYVGRGDHRHRHWCQRYVPYPAAQPPQVGGTLTSQALVSPGAREEPAKLSSCSGMKPRIWLTPTRLFYRDQEVVGWGLKAPDRQSTDVSVREWFKLDLDKGLEGVDKARRPYASFMEKLHEEISGRYASEMLGKTPWEEARLHFLFSVPATWDAPTVETFRDFASAAGFDSPCGHSLDIGLIESQAVAAFQLCCDEATFRFEVGRSTYPQRDVADDRVVAWSSGLGC